MRLLITWRKKKHGVNSDAIALLFQKYPGINPKRNNSVMRNEPYLFRESNAGVKANHRLPWYNHCWLLKIFTTLPLWLGVSYQILRHRAICYRVNIQNYTSILKWTTSYVRLPYANIMQKIERRNMHRDGLIRRGFSLLRRHKTVHIIQAWCV